MVLLVAQMARMSRLLDEALGLDEAGRRQWLQALAPEEHDWRPALRRALLPDGKGRRRGAGHAAPVGFGAQGTRGRRAEAG